ncbi:hypothetical protein MMC13_006514 [Lambiella insularis]|nr:hypothetical protein [Lambiella insularis]
MPFGRPLPATHSLESRFKVLKALTVAEGCNNDGLYKVLDRKKNVVCVEKRFGPELVHVGGAENEIALLRSLKHKNISEYIDSFIENGYLPHASLYMDFCEMGSLNDTLEKYASQGRIINEAFAWHTFKELANALGYIQYGILDVVSGACNVLDPNWTRIIHRDIYPRNIFLKRLAHQRVRVVLGDFGCSVRVSSSMEDLDPTPYNWNHPQWAPPERQFGLPSDIFCIGAVIQEMCRLDGPARRFGLFTSGRHFAGASRYSKHLNNAMRLFMESDWRRRPKIRNIAPQLPKWEAEAEKALAIPQSGHGNLHTGWCR